METAGWVTPRKPNRNDYNAGRSSSAALVYAAQILRNAAMQHVLE